MESFELEIITATRITDKCDFYVTIYFFLTY